jgi:hypothetical protein
MTNTAVHYIGEKSSSPPVIALHYANTGQTGEYSP